ncbi:hypothetical protein ASPWEDRAFT_172793 [Aspergillus wentii DTO 134E9]|uniref:Fucose-specific lectin n=1 Tax=Aspergillus wentii DTO 134E9 TaxID=1073089 RepID=A0A1L9RMG1_ASPWE|nr:uncharacterized protein ASPWEDRAFT_172793 [Aspergillus wentii DTO 134E9]OJJ36008.1 hypothetical protein ASPWEDRAFT_172793 [Aspergillus wentii DTO 134E9]
MSLAVIQNPLAPPTAAEALVFFYSTPAETVVNLGVIRPSLLNDTEYPYNDYNTETHVDVVPESGLEIAFYNGAPRVFGFTKAEPDDKLKGKKVSPNEPEPPTTTRRLTQLSPTVTPIDKDNSTSVAIFSNALTSVYDGSKAYIFAIKLKDGETNEVELVYYTLSTRTPHAAVTNLTARWDTQLAAIITPAGQHRYFFQPDENTIRWKEIDGSVFKDVPNVVAWKNTPIAVTHGYTEPGEKPRYLYLYFVADENNRIYRTRYEYEKEAEKEEDKWDKQPLQLDTRVINQPWRWLKVIPFDEQKNVVFFFDHEDTLIKIEDNLNNSPARAVPVKPIHEN